MRNGYLVKCPQYRCEWSGILPPRRNSWSGSEPSDRAVRFRCPCCQQDWCAHVVGGEAEPLPLDDAEEVGVFPPLEIGVGD